MTKRVKAILDNFDQLSDTEKQDLATEIVRRSVRLDRQPLTDDELIRNAEDRFLDLDDRRNI